MAKKRKVTQDLDESDKLDIIRSHDVQQKMKMRTASKWVALVLVVAILITGTAWGVLSLVEYNSMKIIIDKDAIGEISLSPTEAFDSPMSVMTVKGPDRMVATTYPKMNIDTEVLGIEGIENSPPGYMAYSIYLKNTTDTKDIEYATQISIPKANKNLEKAIRVMVIKTKGEEQEVTVYAHARKDGTPEAIAYDTDKYDTQKALSVTELNNAKEGFLTHNMTVPFMGRREEDTSDQNYYIDIILDQPLKAGEMVKYNVAIWLEGSDSNCIDEILGGYCDVKLEFGITSSEIVTDEMLPKV